MSGTVIQLFLGMVVDILKVQFAVEDFEAVPGLPQSVFATEGFAFLNDALFSGILFCLLPTLFLVPKLYGKIEPLLGMQPRTGENRSGLHQRQSNCLLPGCFRGGSGSGASGYQRHALIDWEAGWAESGTALAAGIVVAALLAVIILAVMRKNAAAPKKADTGSRE